MSLPRISSLDQIPLLADRLPEADAAAAEAARARQTYVLGNPLIEKFQTELSDKLGAVWDVLPHLALTFDEGRLLWRDREVYSKPMGPDNFAFRFFKDGIRQLALLPGVEEGELAEFIELLAQSRPAHDDDLLATLWHRDFKTIRMDYVDASEEEATEVPTPDRNAGAGENLEDMSEIEAARLATWGAYVRPVACVVAGLAADRFDSARSILVLFAALIGAYGMLAVATPDTTSLMSTSST